jgi:F420-non-reducing hydrogenase iron-sulfur subunit
MTVKRITFLQELLGLFGLQERVHLSWISSAEAQKFVEVVTAFTEKIRSLGPNPLSRFSETTRVAGATLSDHSLSAC